MGIAIGCVTNNVTAHRSAVVGVAVTFHKVGDDPDNCGEKHTQIKWNRTAKYLESNSSFTQSLHAQGIFDLSTFKHLNCPLNKGFTQKNSKLGDTTNGCVLLVPAIECIGAYTTKRNEDNILQPTKHGYFNQWLKWQFEVPRVQRSSGGYPSDPFEGVSWYLTQLYIWMPSNLHMGHQLVIWQFPSQQSEQIWDISWDAKSAWPTNPHRNSGSHGSVQSTPYTAWSIPATMQRESQERCDWCIWSRISKGRTFCSKTAAFPASDRGIFL